MIYIQNPLRSFLDKEISLGQSIILNPKSILIILLAFFITLFYQVYIFDKQKPRTCLQAFKINNFSGFYLFLTFLTFSL